MIPLTGTSDPDHMRQDLECFDFELPMPTERSRALLGFPRMARCCRQRCSPEAEPVIDRA